ncbi:HAMP domain-containing sensor histidine kinase [Fulvimarina sp. MAC3]|uniref:sensor histidine kinase n=1 Tax=Fulvimarina sp. MAC3 TaxID=3148887 RepID=UPI0031FCBE43
MTNMVEQRMQVEAGAASAEWAKNEFLSLIGHEFRTPLSIIFGYSRLLSAKLACDSEKRMAASIADNAKHLTDIFNNIMLFVDANATFCDMKTERVSPSDLLETTIRSIEETRPTSAIRIHCETDPDLPEIFIDEERIGIVFKTLLTNALIHGGPNIKATLKRSADDQIVFSVEDDGQLSADSREELFEAFRCVGETSTRRSGGLGLGLSLSERILFAHGGSLSVSVGHGATVFTATIPACGSFQAHAPR